jgi:hypothetical protein
MTAAEMFRDAAAFNQPIASWQLCDVHQLDGMFAGAVAFNQPLDSWGPHLVRVTSTRAMWDGAIAFNQPLPSWVTHTHDSSC